MFKNVFTVSTELKSWSLQEFFLKSKSYQILYQISTNNVPFFKNTETKIRRKWEKLKAITKNIGKKFFYIEESLYF